MFQVMLDQVDQLDPEEKMGHLANLDKQDLLDPVGNQARLAALDLEVIKFNFACAVLYQDISFTMQDPRVLVVRLETGEILVQLVHQDREANLDYLDKLVRLVQQDQQVQLVQVVQVDHKVNRAVEDSQDNLELKDPEGQLVSQAELVHLVQVDFLGNEVILEIRVQLDHKVQMDKGDNQVSSHILKTQSKYAKL